MSVQPTPRSVAASGSADAANVVELTGRVFEVLANGQDTIGLQERAMSTETVGSLMQFSWQFHADFKRTAKYLAQLSEDYTADPDDAFSRIDLNSDHRIDRTEFEQEINEIRGLLGTRKLAAALAQVQQDCEIRQSFADAQPEATGELSLGARTQALEEMVDFFSSLTKDYSVRLEELKQKQELQTEGKTRAPPRARIFGGRKPKPAAADDMKQELTATLEKAAAHLETTLTRKVSTDDIPPDEEDDPEEEEELEEEEADEDEENDEEEELEDEEADDEDPEDLEEDDKDDAEAAEADDQAPGEDLAGTLRLDDPVVVEDPVEAKPVESVDPEAVEPAETGEVTAPVAEATEEASSTQQGAPAETAAEEETAETQPAKAKGKAKKKPKAKPKKVEQAPKKPITKPPAPDASGGSVATEPTAVAARPKAVAKAKPRMEEEGMSCVQTLEMGLAVRNAICIGMEVWTVDWAGNVTVRERDDATKEFKGSLLGGHTGTVPGGVTCLASGDALDGPEIEKAVGAIPRRRAWSGSNDFTIRQWSIDTWNVKDKDPPSIKDGFVFDMGKFRVGVSKGLQMHGHKNGVRCLIRIGPTLWSGADDGTIRLWCTVTGNCNEVVEKAWRNGGPWEAHAGSVLKLAVVRAFIWSSGSDGFIREWTLGGSERRAPKIESRVWRHTIRGSVPQVDELKAANRLFEEEEEVGVVPRRGQHDAATATPTCHIAGDLVK
eukprot:Skav210181  [mRNA]  locus=scaffold2101:212055:219234:- [translate_table: standard]